MRTPRSTAAMGRENRGDIEEIAALMPLSIKTKKELTDRVTRHLSHKQMGPALLISAPEFEFEFEHFLVVTFVWLGLCSCLQFYLGGPTAASLKYEAATAAALKYEAVVDGNRKVADRLSVESRKPMLVVPLLGTTSLLLIGLFIS